MAIQQGILLTRSGWSYILATLFCIQRSSTLSSTQRLTGYEANLLTNALNRPTKKYYLKHRLQDDNMINISLSIDQYVALKYKYFKNCNIILIL